MTCSGGTPKYLYHFLAIEDQVVFYRIEHLHLAGDQLQHVFVVRDHEDIVALFGGLPGQGADHIIGLKTLGLQDGDAKGFQRPADEGQLLGQVRGHFGAVGFVTTVVELVKGLRLDVPFAHRGDAARALIAKDGTAHIEDGGEILRLKVAAEFVDHVDEDEGGRGGNTGARGHGTLPLHRVIGAKDERHGVQEKDRGLGWGGHCPSVEQILELIHVKYDALFGVGEGVIPLELQVFVATKCAVLGIDDPDFRNAHGPVVFELPLETLQAVFGR